MDLIFAYIANQHQTPLRYGGGAGSGNRWLMFWVHLIRGTEMAPSFLREDGARDGDLSMLVLKDVEVLSEVFWIGRSYLDGKGWVKVPRTGASLWYQSRNHRPVDIDGEGFPRCGCEMVKLTPRAGR